MSPQVTEDWMELAIPTDGVEVSPTCGCSRSSITDRVAHIPVVEGPT